MAEHQKFEAVQQLKKLKGKEKIAMLTSYDFVTATYMKEADVDLVLVGDSVGNVLLGYGNTLPVSMDEMLHHVMAVCRAGLKVPVIADMPNNSYTTPALALANAKKFVAQGAWGVKLEGAQLGQVGLLVKNHIAVMGHVGLTPQTISEWKVQGKDFASAKKIVDAAIALEQAGCFSIVIESVPQSLAKEITGKVSVPTIGIGAGPDCDGQVLVINDLIGLNAKDFRPRFVKQYLNLRPQVIGAIKKFCSEVKSREFPRQENSYA